MPRKLRELDEKRCGLLIRMSFHRACVTSKKIIQPLLTRGFARHNGHKAYELTPDGTKAALEVAKKYAGRHIQTYRGLSIGSEVIIVDER